MSATRGCDSARDFEQPVRNLAVSIDSVTMTHQQDVLRCVADPAPGWHQRAQSPCFCRGKTATAMPWPSRRWRMTLPTASVPGLL